jgi:hypothetical protein
MTATTACPIDIPVTRDHPGVVGPGGTPGEGFVQPGIVYADLERHFCLMEARGGTNTATLDVSLVKQDGSVPYRRSFAAARGLALGNRLPSSSELRVTAFKSVGHDPIDAATGGAYRARPGTCGT